MSSPFTIARISFFMDKSNRPHFKVNADDGTLTIEAGNSQAAAICDAPEEADALADALELAAQSVRLAAAGQRARAAVPS